MEVQSSSSHSQISTCSSAYARKAWYVVSFVLSLGRPVCPAEISEKLSFLRWSPEFVEFLCWIPNSPLVLTDDGLITFSPVALVALGRFMARSLLKFRIGECTALQSLRENAIRTYYNKRKRYEVVVPSMNKKRLDSRLLGEGRAVDAVPKLGWTVTRNYFQQAYGKVLVDPLKLNLPGPDNVRLQEIKHTCLGCIHQVRGVEQLKVDSCLVQPASLLSPRVDSLLLDETCMKVLMSKVPNHALSCMKIDTLHHPAKADSPSAINAFEDYGDVQKEMEMGCVVPETSSDILEEAATLRKDLHKESMIDCKNNMVAEEAMRKTSCTLSAYGQAVSQDQRVEDVFPKRKHPKGPNESPLKNKAKQIPKNGISSKQRSENFRTSSSKTINHQQDLSTQELDELSNEEIDDDILQRKCLTSANAFPIRDKSKQMPSSILSIQEKNDNLGSKAMPKFDLYTVEGEEGSGGYGTVYRARRKSDGIKFAIKYPHPNANKYYIDNERKMLQRFGGKDFVIRYEGSCRSDNSECFVLKHVEHDRSDVLKKDISIPELQWYGYCMFTALRSLHKQGVVHRDVKPGNFLFSRKTCLGYIIDFNLAKILHPKQANTGNLLNPYLKTVSPRKRRKIMDSKALEIAPWGVKMGLKPIETKMLRSKALGASHTNSLASQGADGSGLTSAKDFTSTRTPSAERLREPLPCQGRKELINLAQEAMQNTEQDVAGVSSYKRKRIAAPSADMGRKVVYFSPMPIHSSGIAVPGSSFLKEAGKKQKEGSCSGTKGFRAPEVLLRSTHQGPKLDIWSAGVTLLFLMTGKLPFTGDPEQNMKDIVKMRGSEELWEVAKLHDRESSFPKELYDVHYLQSVELRNWCKANTKRPDFFKAIPSSLFDLVNKCLSVNPRSRISAEEALKHEFFAPCIEAIKKRGCSNSKHCDQSTKISNGTNEQTQHKVRV